MQRDYVHGHDRRERQRLQDQAGALLALLHGDTKYPTGSRVLEAGCGVGAQTVALARRSPDAAFVSIDVSMASLAAARRAVDLARLDNVEFQPDRATPATSSPWKSRPSSPPISVMIGNALRY